MTGPPPEGVDLAGAGLTLGAGFAPDRRNVSAARMAELKAVRKVLMAQNPRRSLPLIRVSSLVKRGLMLDSMPASTRLIRVFRSLSVRLAAGLSGRWRATRVLAVLGIFVVVEG